MRVRARVCLVCRLSELSGVHHNLKKQWSASERDISKRTASCSIVCTYNNVIPCMQLQAHFNLPLHLVLQSSLLTQPTPHTLSTSHPHPSHLLTPHSPTPLTAYPTPHSPTPHCLPLTLLTHVQAVLEGNLQKEVEHITKEAMAKSVSW